MIYTGAVVSALASLIASRWFAPIAGDAARYFSPDPDNVEARQKIRLAGIQVIEKLTASKAYDRIIVVGHSLGSAIGLDIVSYGFSRVGANQWEAAHPIGSKAANTLRERSEEHTSELQSLMRISYAVFCLTKKTKNHKRTN